MTQLSVPVDPRDHSIGPLDAPLVLVEYGDYECPHCGAAYPIVKAVLRQLGHSVRFVFRNFPLVEMHQHALQAAETAEWAAEQGQFWAMHDYLFEHQEALAPSGLRQAARSLQLDPGQLAKAWLSGSLRGRIEQDLEGGFKSGVNGTPTFFINGQHHDGAWDVNGLMRALRHAVR